MPVMERVTLLNSAIFFSVNCVFWLLDLWKSFPSKEVYFCLDPQQTPGWSWDVGVGKGDGNYQNFFFFFLVGSHLIHSGKRTLGSHFVYG